MPLDPRLDPAIPSAVFGGAANDAPSRVQPSDLPRRQRAPRYHLPQFWRGAPWLVWLLVAIDAARLHELLGVPAVLRPALVTSVLGVVLLWINTNAAAMRSAISSRPTILVLGYAAWSVVTVPFALWPGLALNTVRSFLPTIVLFGSIVLCAPVRASVESVQRALAFCLAAFAAGALALGTDGMTGRLQVQGSYDSNDMAAVMALGFPLLGGVAARARGVSRLLALLGSVVTVIGVLASGSRGGVLALLTGALVLVLGQRGPRRVKYLIALVGAAIICWNAANPTLRDRMATLLSWRDDYNVRSETGRVEIWKRGVHYLSDNPFLGVGAGNFPIAEGGWLAGQERHGKWSAAHNAYVQAFAELGLIGGTLFVSLLVAAGWRARRAWRASAAAGRPNVRRPELFASLCAFSVGALFLSLAYTHVLFALLGLIFLADRTAHSESAAHPEPRPVGPARR